MGHLKNLREIKNIYKIQVAEEILKYYFKALKETEKEVEALKDKYDELFGGDTPQQIKFRKDIDKTFTHKEAIKLGEEK